MSQQPPFAPTPPAVPPPAYGYSPSAPTPQRANGIAIASLICGLIMCVPVITGLFAIVFGWLGVRRARDPQSGGKGFAVAGIALGIVSIVGWAVFGAIMMAIVNASAPGRNVARQFLKDMSSGNVAAAKAQSVPGMSQAELTSASQQLQPWGALKDVTFTGINMEANAGSDTTLHLNGTATFANGRHNCEVKLVKQSGIYKVKAYSLEP